MLSKGMIEDIVNEEGKQFADNFSATGCSLCLKVDVENDRVYYQECYSRYGNFTGKNIKGDPRTDQLRHPPRSQNHDHASILWCLYWLGLI